MIEKKTSQSDTLEALFNQNANQTVNNTPTQKNDGGNFVLSYPSSFEDIKSIIDGLKNGCSALVSFSKVAKAATCQRMLDYLSGAAYALSCNVRKIQEGQYLFTANGVSIKINQ